MRERASVLFTGSVPPTGPPDPEGPAEAGEREPRTAGPRLPWRQRARLALLDRLPRWAAPRCGVAPRTLAAVGVVLAIATGFAVHHYATGRPRAAPAPEPVPVAASTAEPGGPVTGGDSSGSGDSGGSAGGSGDAGDAGEPGSVVVDVAGEVAEPGVITLPEGSRVADALRAAGGVTPGTDITGLNRARVLADGEHLVVGAAGQEAAPAPGPGSARPPAEPGPVNLNTATAEELQTLPGIGPVLAGHIVDHRDRHGRFTAVEQLLEVSGIGDRRLADLRDRVVL